MKKNITILLMIFLLVPSVFADWRDSFEAPETVYLSEILKAPETWLGVPVNIVLRFQEHREVYNPFFTPFNKEEYMNFAAWDVQTHIWEKEGFLNAYPFFYVDKENQELQTFLKLERFDTINILAKVDGLFKGSPYFRVVWVYKLPGHLGISNLTLLNRGMRAFRERNFDKAMSYYQKVFASNPPDDIKAFLHKTQAQIYLYEKRSYVKALSEVKKGLKYTPKDLELARLLRQSKYHIRHGGAARPFKAKRMASPAPPESKDPFFSSQPPSEEDSMQEYQPVSPQILTEEEPKKESKPEEELSQDDEIPIEEAYDSYEEEIPSYYDYEEK